MTWKKKPNIYIYMETVNGLWIGTLGRLQILSIKSWLKAGYKYNLWVYDLNMVNVPEGVKLCDANIILDKKYIFKHWSGTYATFADMFRYKLLYDIGGWWVDLDLVCLRQLPDIEIFFGAERTKLRGAFKSKNKHRLWIGLLKFPPTDEDPLCLNAKDPILKDMFEDMMAKIEDFQNPEKKIPFTYGQTRLDKLLKKIVGNDEVEGYDKSCKKMFAEILLAGSQDCPNRCFLFAYCYKLLNPDVELVCGSMRNRLN